MMKRILSTVMLFALFGIIISGFASALTLSVPSNSLSETSKNATLTLTNNDNATQNVQLTISNIVDGANSVGLTISPASVTSIAAAGTQVLNVNVANVIGILKFGTYTSTITAKGDNGTTVPTDDISSTQTITFTKSFCSKGSTNKDLVINSVDISNSGDEDDEWLPLDEVEVEVEVENTGDDNINDIFVEMALFDSTGRDQVGDLDFDNADEEKIDLGRLNDNEEETVIFTFIVPADFEPGSYRLAVKVYSDDDGENVECSDTSDDLDNEFFESISVDRESDEGKFIAFDNIEITPSQVTCGDTVTVSADVFNVGDDEQDQIRINFFSTELGIRLEKEIRENMDEGDNTDVSFTFTVPQGLKAKLYNLEFEANYDYRNGDYRETSDETTRIGLNVLDVECTGGQVPTGRIAVITADLDSDAKPGEELLVRATITGLISGEADYLIAAKDFESWADLQSISEPLVSLEQQDSKEIILAFDVNKDATGDQSFTLEVRSEGKTETREVQVNIEESATGGSITGGVTGALGSGNNLIWVIGIINVVLIILIIVVAMRISRK